jgi:CBS domain-containing protein
MELDKVTLQVGELKSDNLVSVQTEENVIEVAKLMDQKEIGSVLVRRKGELVGIITDRDIITRVLSKGLDAATMKVSEAMSSPLMTIEENASVEDAAKKMAKHHLRRLVVEKNNQKVGLISESDIIRVDPELHFLISEQSKLEARMVPNEPHTFTLAGFCEECGNYSARLRKIDGQWLDEDCRD